MTPAEKAKWLVDKFKQHSYYDAHDLTSKYQREQSNIESAKECALIAVEELILATHTYRWHEDVDWAEVADRFTQDYWLLVKVEIEKL